MEKDEFNLFLRSMAWRGLRFAFGLLALRAAEPLGGVPRPLKTPTQRRFSCGFEPL